MSNTSVKSGDQYLSSVIVEHLEHQKTFKKFLKQITPYSIYKICKNSA